ncbi:8342_t:CDS:2, partial [Scutellospora calospora]
MTFDGIQQISSTAIGNVLRDELEKSQKQNLRNSLDRLTIDILKVIYRGESLSEKRTKKDLVKRLADRVLSKAKSKDKIPDNTQVENIEEMRIGFDLEKGLQDNVRNRPFGNTDRIGSMEKMMQAMMGKVIGKIKKNQFEYDEWYKVRKYLDNALSTEIRELLIDNLIEALFHDKLASARQTAKNPVLELKEIKEVDYTQSIDMPQKEMRQRKEKVVERVYLEASV